MLEIFIGLTIAVLALLVLGFAGYVLTRYILRNKDTDRISTLPLPDFRNHLPTRWTIIILLALALFIPLGLIDGVVSERHYNYKGVLSDISKRWGNEQILTGPILVVPYQYRYQVTKNILNKNGIYQDITEWHESTHKAIILPDQLDIRSHIDPEYRQRSIYQSLVYRMSLNLSGNFEQIETRIKTLSDASKLHKIYWDKAYISLGLSDPSGVENANKPQVNNTTARFSPGSNLSGLIKSGLHIPFKITDPDNLPFTLNLALKGSRGFRITPVGEQTNLKLNSSWQHPSFYGDLLPTNYEIIEEQGFSANWSVSRLVRSYPQQWVLHQNNHKLDEISLGVQLFEPVTLYTQTTRAVKYGILFISLTFISLLLIEWVTGIRPGFLQYILIGASLSLFYLLLIALAEHTGFTLAYCIASLIVIGMVGLYSSSILKRRALAGLISTVLLTLYSVLYLILQSEDYALLSGAVLITVTLAASMYFTSREDTKPTNQPETIEA